MTKILFLLLAGHALADFCLQTPWIAKNKNPHSGPPEGYDPKIHGPMQTVWPYVLTAHSLTHGLMVFLATGDYRLGLAETVAHWAIDYAKCQRMFGIHMDQFLHIACKFLWVYLMSMLWM
jgi:hypothetical protein